MKLFQRLLLGLVVLLAMGLLGFLIWAYAPIGPSARALEALETRGSVMVTDQRIVSFAPRDQSISLVGFIFYPGGHIDARAYAPLLRGIAEQGYLAVLVPVRLNLALFDVNAADAVLRAYPEVEKWVIGGHSLGGVAAAKYAEAHPQIGGLVLLASYPSGDMLRSSDLHVLSIYGTNDMAGMQKFEETRSLLPDDTHYVVIDGGNHAQFGDYGPQPGDNPATVSRQEQQAQAIRAIVAFMASFVK